MLRYLTAGESHGRALVATIEGLPAHVKVTSAEVADALARRRLGVGRGARMKFEADEVTLLTGVRHGETLGSPVAIMVGNSEWAKWETVMAPDPVDAAELEQLARNAALTRPRPGHADLAGMQKYDWDEARPILERASARETAARVALGRLAANFLEQAFGIQVLSHVVSIGGVGGTSGDPSSLRQAQGEPSSGSVGSGSGDPSSSTGSRVNQAQGAPAAAERFGCVDAVVRCCLQPVRRCWRGRRCQAGDPRRVIRCSPRRAGRRSASGQLDASGAGSMGIQAIRASSGRRFGLADPRQQHGVILPARTVERLSTAPAAPGWHGRGEPLRVRAVMSRSPPCPGAANHRRQHRRGRYPPPADICAVPAAG